MRSSSASMCSRDWRKSVEEDLPGRAVCRASASGWFSTANSVEGAFMIEVKLLFEAFLFSGCPCRSNRHKDPYRTSGNQAAKSRRRTELIWKDRVARKTRE